MNKIVLFFVKELIGNNVYKITICNIFICLCMTLNANIINVPSDFVAIQAAHDAASSGDVILLQPGVYTESITLTKAITLASLFFTTGDESFISSTVIDGGGTGTIILIPATAEQGIVITGITLQNGTKGIVSRQKFDCLNNIITDTRDGIDYENGSGGICRFNRIEANGDDGLDLDNDVDLIAEHNVIANNGDDGFEIRLQNYTGPHLNIIIRFNEIYGNDEDGIQLIDYNSVTISNRFFDISQNYIYNNTDVGIGCMSNANTVENFEAASIEETIYVYNNTFANNSHGITGGDSMVVVNNVFVGHPIIAVKNVDGNSELANNIFFSNGIDTSGSNLISGTNLFNNPLLDANFGLIAGSPAIDAGVTTYLWQGDTVFSYTSADFSGTSRDIGAFEFNSGTGTPPDVPILVAPVDGATDVVLTPTLDWNGTADVFNLEMATDGGFVNTIFSSAGSITVTEHTVPVGILVNNTLYFWRVSGSNSNGTGSWSTVWSFTTEVAAGPPAPPVLITPVDDATDLTVTPTLDWAGTADNFDFEVATDSNFTTTVFSSNSPASEATVSSGVLDQQTLYFWRVRGSNAFGPGEWSDVFLFTTQDPPDTTPPFPPLNLVTIGQTVSTISLDWDESTDNVGVTGYNIYEAGIFVGAETSSQHTAEGLDPATSYDYFITALDAAGNESDPSDVITVSTLNNLGPFIVSSGVSASNDDAEERASGTVILISTDLELILDKSDQTVGLRFNTMNIPQAAVISDAFIQFTADETHSESNSLRIQGEAADNPEAFSSSSFNISTRPKTTATVPWSPAAWTSIGEAGPDQQTPDISSIIQEIVNRPGWASGNSMVLIITGNGKRVAESYNAGPNVAPILTVEYNLPVGDTPDVSITTPTNDSTFVNGDAISFTGTATDTEDGDLTASLSWESHLDGAMGSGGSFTTGSLSTGVHMIIASVEDSDSQRGTAQITLTIAEPNSDNPPVANGDSATTPEETLVTVDVAGNDTDIDGNLDPTSANTGCSTCTIPANGILGNNGDGTFDYTPNTNFNGSDTFVYEICDSGAPGLCATAAVTITVSNINDKPVANEDSATTPEETLVTVDVAGNDTDVDGNLDPTSANTGCATCTIPANGTLSNKGDGTFDYTPNTNFNGSDTFVYEICDGDTPSLCDTAQVTITVSSINDAPVANDDSISIPEETLVTVDVAENDTDVDGDLDPASANTACTTCSDPVNGTLLNNQDGTFDYIPNTGFVGTDSFVYEICDSDTQSLCDTAQATITVSNINEAPVANEDTATTPEETLVTVDVAGNDTDIDGNLDPTSANTRCSRVRFRQTEP